MAKSLTLITADGTRVPFLRGILTRSLQAAGLPFDEAYAIASAVRDEIRDEVEITTRDLEERVLRRLAGLGEEVGRRYRTRRAVLPPILVQHADGHEAPFSRGRHRVALSPCGISRDVAVQVVERLVGRLAAEDVTRIPAPELDRMTYGLLKEELGAESARRFAVWKEFLHSDTPLVVLIGGATGVGKSTIAAEVCNRLDIVRAQSTDMLREVMRMMVPKRLLPVLYASSFLAWEALPQRDRPGGERDDLEAGYLAQVELVGVACEAVFQRAEQERVSLVLEGVHVHPTLLERVPGGAEAVVVPVMLGILKPKRLRQQIKGRGQRIPGRRAKRYLQHFDDIWRLQAYLLSEADRAGIPIVTSTDVDETVDLIVGLIIDELSRTFTGKPSTVFR